MQKKFKKAALLVALLLLSSAGSAQVYVISGSDSIIGYTRKYTAKDDESLIEIARQYDIGYNEIIAANPCLDPFIPGNGVSVILPTSWILPDPCCNEGIIVNLSELRLYFFFKLNQKQAVRTFPIGIGSEENRTPVGNFRVIDKIINPTWYVPESIRKEKRHLPKVVPPGPDNSLGSHALILSQKNVLIHGTNKPFGIGRKVSHGCIRLYPEDIIKLFELVPRNTRVSIIRQPVKVGTIKDEIYIEVHQDDSLRIDYLREAEKILQRKNLYNTIDKEKLHQAIDEKRGTPVLISKETIQ